MTRKTYSSIATVRNHELLLGFTNYYTFYHTEKYLYQHCLIQMKFSAISQC